MKKVYVAVILFIVSSISLWATNMNNIDNGVNKIASVLIAKMHKYHIERVAMGDIATNGIQSMFERYIDTELVNAIISKDLEDIHIIERRRLSEVLHEQKLGSVGLLEKNTRAAIGKILGAGAIISGETTVTSKEIKVNIRLYAVETGSILAAPSFTFKRNETIDELMTEPVMYNRNLPLRRERKTAIKFQNRVSQKIGYILVTVLNVKKVKNEVHITLKFVSTRKKIGASVAIYAEGSDNIADFWKFLPRPKMIELSDENGYAYRFKNTTMKYAKTGKDWTTVYPRSEQIVKFIFANSSEVSVGKRLTFSVLMRTAMADHNGKPTLSSATLYLDGLVPN